MVHTPSRGRLAVLAGVAALAGVGCDRPCSTLFEVSDQDWCLAGEAVRLAEQGQLARARYAVESIQMDHGRAAAVEGVLTTASASLDRADAVTWCGLLSDAYAERCLGMWDREAAWP